MLINPSCQNDRDFFLIFFFVFSYYGNNFFYFFSINLWSKFSYLFFMETKMSSCHRTFNNNKICCFFIFFIPEFQNNMGRFSGRYNGSDCNTTIFYISRKINRKPCSWYDKVSSRCNHFTYIRFIIIHCHHQIKTNDSLWRNLSCFIHLFMNRTFICFYWILIKIRFTKTNLRSRYRSGSTFFCDSSGQSAKTDTNAHTTLYDRDF